MSLAFLDPQDVRAVGWSLLHFVWQGAAMAALLAGLDALARCASAPARYLLASATLLAMLVLPVATFLAVRGAEPVESPPAAQVPVEPRVLPAAATVGESPAPGVLATGPADRAASARPGHGLGGGVFASFIATAGGLGRGATSAAPGPVLLVAAAGVVGAGGVRGVWTAERSTWRVEKAGNTTLVQLSLKRAGGHGNWNSSQPVPLAELGGLTAMSVWTPTSSSPCGSTAKTRKEVSAHRSRGPSPTDLT